MGETRSLLILSVLYGGVSFVRLMASLAVIYLGLGWNVWKARRALEKELMKAGMSKHDAQRIGAQYAALKDDTVRVFKRSITGFRFRF